MQTEAVERAGAIATRAGRGDPLWWMRIGNGNVGPGHASALDGAGNLIVSGRFKGVLGLGGPPLLGRGEGDVFALKLDPTGRHLWSRRFGVAAGQQPWSMAVTDAGHVFLAGAMRGRLDLGPGAPPLVGVPSALFAAKLDPGGRCIWQRPMVTLGLPSVERQSLRLAADRWGCLFVLGQGALAGAARGHSRFCDLFLLKLDPSGSPLWARSFTGAQQTRGHRISVDAQGHVVASGSFRGALSFGGESLESVSGWDHYLVKLDPQGNLCWSKRLAARRTSSYRMTHDEAGGLLLGGALFGEHVARGSQAPGVCRWSLFMAGLDGSGNVRFARRFPGDEHTSLHVTLAAAPEGGALAAGYFEGSLDFGGGREIRSLHENESIYVARFDAAGAAAWARCFRGARRQLGLAVHADRSGAAYLTGLFDGEVDFGGPARLASRGSEPDLFVVKLAP